jgi:GntR family transcriptional repressor for pyruvate dehydrogenase complex
LANTYSCADNPEQFLVHDIRFNRALAAASGNPILATLVNMVSAMHYDLRRRTVRKAKALREAADMHQRIFRAIRARNVEAARNAMHAHILQAQQAYRLEAKAGRPSGVSSQSKGNRHKNRIRGGGDHEKSRSKLFA